MTTGGYKLINNSFGKGKTKILHLSRNGPLHSIRELEIVHRVILIDNKEYIKADNTGVVENDAHAKLLYILAKNEGINSPEEFGAEFCKELLSKYKEIVKVYTYIEETTWDRIKYGEDGKGHNRGFVKNPTCIRFTSVEQGDEDEHPSIISGFKNFRVLKTTKSTFHGFICDEYCFLPDIYDRFLSTSMDCSWTYTKNPNINFDETFKKIQQIILFNFAGNCDDGLLSTSTQSTSYLTEKAVLDKVKEVKSIEMTLPNLYYNAFDFQHFRKFGNNDGETVMIPLEHAHGLVHSELKRE